MFSVLKFVALAIASLSGVLGAATETHDRTSHRLTKWGVWAILLTCLGAIVAVLAQTFEVIQSNAAAIDSAEQRRVDDCRVTNLLTMAERASHPFSNSLEVEAELVAPLHPTAVKVPTPLVGPSDDSLVSYFGGRTFPRSIYNGAPVPAALDTLWRRSSVRGISMGLLANSFWADDPRRTRLYFDVQLPELVWADANIPSNGPTYGTFAWVSSTASEVKLMMRGRVQEVENHGVKSLGDLNDLPFSLVLGGPLSAFSVRRLQITENSSHQIILSGVDARPFVLKPGRRAEAYFKGQLGRVGPAAPEPRPCL
jgi:hypothetical protein